jgi:hypothetical protein
MTRKNGVKETNKCQVTNTLANSVENSYPLTTMYVLSVEKSTRLDLKDALNAEPPSKLDRLIVAVAA